MPWLTPIAMESARQTWALDIPASHEWRRNVWGALLKLSHFDQWEESDGGLTVEETVDEYLEVYYTLRRVFVMKPGDILTSLIPPPRENLLLCDGGSYAATEYPELFLEVGYAFGGADGAFNVPDFRSRFIVGAGHGPGLTTRNSGEAGGTERATILETNLPPHTHSTHAHIPAVAQLGVGEPVSIPNPLGEQTGPAGGGDPIDIMPPYRAAYIYIVARGE
jgi:hypothetical protein